MTTRGTIDHPRVEGTVQVAPRRVLGFAEFGDPAGHPCLWFHGTPGGRRQVAPLARAASLRMGVRIICVERPGSGVSTPHGYGTMIDAAADIEAAADQLGLDRFAIIGLSGGGPYTLACAAALPHRVVGVGVMGGVAPSVGPDAASGGVTALAARFAPLMHTIEAPLGVGLRRLLQAIMPFRHQAYDAFKGLMPPADRRVFDSDGVREMFMDDITRAIHAGGIGAALRDVVLFGRDWGFRPGEITVPVHWWHGDEDSIVPLDHGRHVAGLIPGARFHLNEGDSHLSGYAAADDVIAAVVEFFA